MYTMITDQDQLIALFSFMENEQTYYLDTEFIRMRTRYPQLGLIQLNINQKIFLIDPLKLDLASFWQKIYSAEQNVIHACSEDVFLISHYAQRQDLYNVFDTQIALDFLGYGRHMGYQSAVREFLGIQVQKHESRSNWLTRPLTKFQLDYAANDVIYLYDLAKEIKKKLGDLYGYVLQDCQCFIQELINPKSKSELYLELAHPKHTRRELAQIQQLCIWREELSIANNIPASFILKNHDLLMMIQHQPKTEHMLHRILAQNSRSKQYSYQILRQLHQLPKANNWPQRIPYPSGIDVEQQDKIKQLIQNTANSLNINADTIMRKKWLNELIYNVANSADEQDLNPYLLGWRYDIITLPILKLLYTH